MLQALIAAQAAALLHSTMVSSQPLVTPELATGPRPQDGVWALLPKDCAAPESLDLSTWPKCATPIGFVDDEVAALEKPGPGKKATASEFYSIARTRFAMAPGLAAPSAAPTAPASPGPAQGADAAALTGGTIADPPAKPAVSPTTAIAQVVVPMIFSRSFYYLSITPDALDTDGRFAAARGWPVACRAKGDGGCAAASLADVQTQAAVEPTDATRAYRLIRVQPPKPEPAPAPAEAPPATPAPAGTTLPPP